VFFEDIGFVIDYIGNAQERDGEQDQACLQPNDLIGIELFFFQPGQMGRVVEWVLPPDTIDYIADADAVYALISWEVATGTTLESFYERFSQPDNNTCFEFTTPRREVQ
jgi:hypothetical protein